MTLYQKIRALLSGKRNYTATKDGEVRKFYASSLEQAQLKFITWDVVKYRSTFMRLLFSALE